MHQTRLSYLGDLMREPCSLWDLGNVLISPHFASTVEGENGRIVDIFARNYAQWQAGRFGNMENVLAHGMPYWRTSPDRLPELRTIPTTPARTPEKLRNFSLACPDLARDGVAH